MKDEHDGEKVLAVSHGLFLRIMQAVYYGVEAHAIEKMENAEVRILTLEPSQHFDTSVFAEVGATAN